MVPIGLTPLALQDWWRGYPGYSRNSEFKNLANRLRRTYGYEYVVFVPSGNTALALLLRALMAESEKRQIIMPAYGHGSLAVLVQSLGLEPVLVDSVPSAFTQSHDRVTELCTGETLGVLVQHIFGLPAYRQAQAKILADLPCSVLEDCTQAVGTRWRKRPIGVVGRAAWMSFGYGENLSVSGGGAILTQDLNLFRSLNKLAGELREISNGRNWGIWMTMAGARVATTRAGYRMAWHLMRKNRTSRIAESYPTHRFSAPQAAVASALWSRLEIWSGLRYRHGMRLKELLTPIKGVVVPEIGEESEPAFNRFPLVIKHRGLRDQVRMALSRAGVEASPHYPQPLHRMFPLGYPTEKDPFPQASYLADRLLTLPVHPKVRPQDVSRMVEIIGKICG